MNYRRVLVVTTAGADSHPTLAALRFYVPAAEHVTVLEQQPTSRSSSLTPPAHRADGEQAVGALESWQRSLPTEGRLVKPKVAEEAAKSRAGDRRLAPQIDIRLASEIGAAALTDMVTSTGVDLVAVDSHAHDTIPLVAEVRKRTNIAVLYVPENTAPTRLAGRLLCVGLTPRERRAVVEFLNAHTGKHDRAVMLSGTALSAEQVRQIRDVTGLTLEVEVVPGTADTLRRLLTEDAGLGAHLIVVARFPPAFLLPTHRGHPVLILPALRRVRTTTTDTP